MKKLMKQMIGAWIVLMFSSSMQAATISYKLNEGWNLLGANLDIQDLSPLDASDSFKIAWIYNDETGRWSFYPFLSGYGYNALENVDAGTGFWLYFTDSETLTLQGTEPANHLKNVWKGWNLIGLNADKSTAVSNFFNYQNGDVFTKIWKYVDGQYTKYEPSDSSSETVDVDEGFWIISTQDLQFDFDDIVNASSSSQTSSSSSSTSSQSSVSSISSSSSSSASGLARYNEVQQKSAHNSYGRDESMLDQMIYHRVRSVEFDLHAEWTILDIDAPEGDWWVYHSAIDPRDATSVETLSKGLMILKHFHDLVPEHQVVTVWIDFKDSEPFKIRSRSDFDGLLREYLGSDLLFTPSDLLEACPGANTLKEAVTQDGCGWPWLEELQGKFIFVIAEGADEYEGQGDYQDAAAFLSSKDSITSGDDVVFYNYAISGGAFDTSKDPNTVFANGYISRSYISGDLGCSDDDDDDAVVMQAHNVNHLATNCVNYHEHPAWITHTSTGFPFTCVDAAADCSIQSSTPDEPMEMLAYEAKTDAIWSSDLALYTTENMAVRYLIESDGEATWSTYVSKADSHTEEWALGCLFASAGLGVEDSKYADSYFAICRPGNHVNSNDLNNDNVVAAIWHHEQDSVWDGSGDDWDTEDEPDTVPDGISLWTAMHLKLELSDGGKRAKGYISFDGSDWYLVNEQSFDQPLLYQGIMVTSNGSDSVKYLFGNLSKDGNGVEKNDLVSAYFGTVSSSNFHEGIF